MRIIILTILAAALLALPASADQQWRGGEDNAGPVVSKVNGGASAWFSAVSGDTLTSFDLDTVNCSTLKIVVYRSGTVTAGGFTVWMPGGTPGSTTERQLLSDAGAIELDGVTNDNLSGLTAVPALRVKIATGVVGAGTLNARVICGK